MVFAMRANKPIFMLLLLNYINRSSWNISLLNLGKLAKALNVGVYQLFSAVQEYEKFAVTEAPSEMKEILLKLQNRSAADLKRANAILNEIFKQY
ncbi:hypothetical protein D3C84_1168660 [compost metagenome]